MERQKFVKKVDDLKKGHQNFRRIEIVDFGVKFLKTVVLKFFGQMCSDEFFLKHALAIEHGSNLFINAASRQRCRKDIERAESNSVAKEKTKRREIHRLLIH